MADAEENELVEYTEDGGSHLVPFDTIPDHVLLNIFFRLSYAELCKCARYTILVLLITHNISLINFIKS